MKRILFVLLSVTLWTAPYVYAQEKTQFKTTSSLSEILYGFIDHYISYTVKPNDTLAKIAHEQGTTVEFIRKVNRLSNDELFPGQRLTVWHAPFTIEVNKRTNHLYLNVDGTTIKEYRVSTGRSDTVTPLGEFIIASRYPNPTWFHKGKVVPGGDPQNWLGTRWLGFDKPKYGIHGTIFPEQIGQSVSGGCVRMKNQDIEELYDYIPIGTKVTIEE